MAVDELELVTEGRVDLQGLLELNGVAAAFAGITVTLRVLSGADDTVLKELGRTVARASPTYASLSEPVPMQLSVQRLARP